MGIVNIASEKAYEGLDALVGEILDVFKSSPYFHIGCDEPWAIGNMANAPQYAAYMEKHGLKDPHELYLHYIVRMDQIVRKHGRRSIMWGDFGGASTEKANVPTDIVAIAWENGNTKADALVKKGHPVVNGTWNPLYVVNQTKESPDVADPARVRQAMEAIYSWNLYQFDVCKVEPTGKVIGAQLCAWEQGGEVQVPALRTRVPAMSERIWNPAAGKDLADFVSRFESVNPLLDALIKPYPGR
jgi:hexosaminidase